MKKSISEIKKLSVKAMEQNCEVMLKPKDYVHIAFWDRKFKVVVRWMPSYDMVNDANKYQLN